LKSWEKVKPESSTAGRGIANEGRAYFSWGGGVAGGVLHGEQFSKKTSRLRKGRPSVGGNEGD